MVDVLLPRLSTAEASRCRVLRAELWLDEGDLVRGAAEAAQVQTEELDIAARAALVRGHVFLCHGDEEGALRCARSARTATSATLRTRARLLAAEAASSSERESLLTSLWTEATRHGRDPTAALVALARHRLACGEWSGVEAAIDEAVAQCLIRGRSRLAARLRLELAVVYRNRGHEQRAASVVAHAVDVARSSSWLELQDRVTRLIEDPDTLDFPSARILASAAP